MSKRDTMIRALCKSLGVDYRVTTIDLERVIYRDFGNGFNVEISGMHTSSMKKKATIYLWYGDTMTECIIVKTVRDIPSELIGENVEELMKYSNLLIAQGYDSYDKLFRLKYGKTINYAGGVKNMTHRIFYGTDFKLTDSDKKMFSREGYECKDLLQGRAGLPVVVSQKQDKDFPIWKVQYGFSCLVFPTYEDAMDFCRDRFTRLDGKAV